LELERDARKGFINKKFTLLYKAMSKMTEEESKIAEELKANAKPEGEAQEEKPLEKIDYEAIAKEERERREAAERLLAEDRYRASERKRQEEAPEDEDKPLTTKDLKAFETRITSNATKISQEALALQIARENTTTEAEAEAALLFWKNRVIPTGNLEEDVKFAIGGLNQKKITAKKAELSRALRSKDSISSDTAGTQRDGLPKAEPKLPDNSPLKEYKYEGKGIYSKKLPSGKMLFRNSKPAPGQPKSWTE